MSKRFFFCIFENVDDVASKCKNNYGAAAKIGKVMKDCVQKGYESKNGENAICFSLRTYNYQWSSVLIALKCAFN